jgi:hypothetical protein
MLILQLLYIVYNIYSYKYITYERDANWKMKCFMKISECIRYFKDSYKASFLDELFRLTDNVHFWIKDNLYLIVEIVACLISYFYNNM